MTFPNLHHRGGGIASTHGVSGYLMTTVTAAGSTHTKGSWAELVSSTPFDSHAFTLHWYNNTHGVNHLLDVGIGAASSEQVIVPNVGFPCNNSDSRYGMQPLFMPISIPEGTRIAVRKQSTVASDAGSRCAITLHQAPFALTRGWQRCFNHGANTGSTSGTTIDPGGTANTKGSWVEITSACDHDVRALIINEMDYNNLPSSYYWSLDVAIGAASSEEIVVHDHVMFKSSSFSYNNMPRFSWPLPVEIPSGSRIAARAQCTGTNSVDRLLEINLLCLG